MALSTGWIEKRQHERKEAAWEVTYQVLDLSEAETICRQPHFQDLIVAKEKTLGFHGLTRDISQGGFSIVGDQSLKQGSALMVYLHHYQYRSSLVAVAKVAHTSERAPEGPFQYRSGLKILAVDVDSLDRIIQDL